MGLLVDEATVWTLFACPFHALTGLYCPLCGSTRAVLALVHGEVLLALRCNLLLVGVVMWTAAVVVRGVAAAGLGGAKAPPYNERNENERDQNERDQNQRDQNQRDQNQRDQNDRGENEREQNRRDQNPRDLVGRGFSPGTWRSWAALTAVAIYTVARNLPGTWWLRP